MSKEKLLLVEDDVNFGFVLKSYLEMNNFYVTLITDGKDAVNAFLSREYNLCILDVMLPNVDGFTIAKEIKRISPSCPVIFLTARSLKEDIMEGFRIGADDYLTADEDSRHFAPQLRHKAGHKRRGDNRQVQVQHQDSLADKCRRGTSLDST